MTFIDNYRSSKMWINKCAKFIKQILMIHPCLARNGDSLAQTTVMLSLLISPDLFIICLVNAFICYSQTLLFTSSKLRKDMAAWWIY